MKPLSSSGDQIEPALHQARELLCNASKIAVFTGAGVSAESGIPTFRDAGGMWTRFPPEQFANWKGLEQMMLSNLLRFLQYGPRLNRARNVGDGAKAL